jgi:hypothetical protein
MHMRVDRSLDAHLAQPTDAEFEHLAAHLGSPEHPDVLERVQQLKAEGW